MNDNNRKDSKDNGLRQDGPDAYAGFVADDADGDSSIGHRDGGNKAGNSQSGINSNFAQASPESNVGPAGAAQVSHGNATGDVPGGTRGKAPGERNKQAADVDAATPAVKPERQD
ncbi:hypothetical protein AB2N08_08860 [Massilia aurea]|uniref:hypothetical protein n=1 Tax=Massilia aurea TaxID=373040 RepID=UPI00346216F9